MVGHMIFAKLTHAADTFTLGPEIISSPSAFLARAWFRQHLGDDTAQVAVYAGVKPRLVAEIRTEGNAAGARNTLRHEVRERVGGRWTGWRRLT